MNHSVPYIVIRKFHVIEDWKLHIEPKDKNNGRKFFVNEIYHNKELQIQDPEWQAGPIKGKTPVFETGFGGLEIATFTHEAGQDRHKHLIGTEIYTVLEGIMAIWVEDREIMLNAGDEIVILPNTVHEVLLKEDIKFLTRVHSINCYGDRDK